MDPSFVDHKLFNQVSKFSSEEIIALKTDVLTNSLKEFLKYFWPVIESRKFVDGWIIDAKCEHLEALAKGHIKRLIINEPPRHMKSTLANVIWPAWRWLRNPKTSFMTLAYAADRAFADAAKMRRIVESSKFQELCPLKFHKDQNTKTKFQNNLNGWRFSSSVRGQLVGEGADVIIADDPNGPESLRSEADRQDIWYVWREVLGTRDNDALNPCRLVIQQRLAESDLTGLLLEYETDDWTVLKLPIEYNRAAKVFISPIGFKDPRKIDGEILWPERFDKDTINKMRKQMAFTASGQLDQEPVTLGGGIFPADRWPYYTSLPEDIDYFSIWGDLTFKGEVENDYCAIALIAHKGDKNYIVHMASGQWDFLEQVKEIRNFKAKFPFVVHWYLEDAGNAPAVKATLEGLNIHGIELIPARKIGSKDYLWSSGQHMVASGQILLPQEFQEYSPEDRVVLNLPGDIEYEVNWDIRDRLETGVNALIIEAGKVPRGKNDDMIDAVMKGCLYAKINPCFYHGTVGYVPGNNDPLFGELDRKPTSSGYQDRQSGSKNRFIKRYGL